MLTILALYDANETEPPEWELILSSVCFNRLRFEESDRLWNPSVDQTSCIMVFQSSFCIQMGPLLTQSIIFEVFSFDIALVRARANCWFKEIRALYSQIFRTICSSSSGKAYVFYQINMISKIICKQHQQKLQEKRCPYKYIS